MIKTNRRQFLYTAALGTAGFAGAAATHPFPFTGFFSWDKLRAHRALTPSFLTEDVNRLVQLSSLDKAVRRAIYANLSLLHLGRAWEIAPEHLAAIFRESRQHWQDRDQPDRIPAQFALACGVLIHRIFQKQFSTERDHSTPELAEADLYRDTYLMKMFQNADPRRKQLPLDGPLKAIEPAAVSELFHLIQQRNLIRMHTLRPEFSNIEQWLSDFLQYYNLLKKDNDRYAEVYCRPESAKVTKHVMKTPFYDPADPVILIARNFQMAVIDNPATIRTGLTAKTATSRYGQALSDALQKVREVGEYVTGVHGPDAVEALVK